MQNLENTITFFFISNLKIHLNNKINYFNVLKNKKLLFKYILLLIFFNGIKHINKNFKINVFIKKKKITKFTYLNAPYRYKLSKCHLGFQRFYINFKKVYRKHLFIVQDSNQILLILKFFFKKNNIYESNLIFLKKKKITINLIYKNNFLIRNY